MGAKKEPDVVVKQTVEVRLSRSEVELALRLHLEHRLAADRIAPAPKQGGDVWIAFSAGEDWFDGATLTYEPADQEQRP